LTNKGSLPNYGQCNLPADLGACSSIEGGGYHTIALQCIAGVNAPMSPELAPFSFANPRSWTATGIQTSSNGATITVNARGNLGTATKFLSLKIDGVTLATNIFGSGSGATNCAASLSTATFIIPPAQFRKLTTDGELEVRIEPSLNATSAGCSAATLSVTLNYNRDTIDCDANGLDDECDVATNPALDCNSNGVLDSCDSIADPALDCDQSGTLDNCDIAAGAEDDNQNGKLDSCELLYGDLNLDGRIDGSDLGGLLALWGITNPPYGDLDGNQRIDGADLGKLLSHWGVVN
jgi:hypothetical protein